MSNRNSGGGFGRQSAEMFGQRLLSRSYKLAVPPQAFFHLPVWVNHFALPIHLPVTELPHVLPSRNSPTYLVRSPKVSVPWPLRCPHPQGKLNANSRDMAGMGKPFSDSIARLGSPRNSLVGRSRLV